jgi:hypothetical protein
VVFSAAPAAKGIFRSRQVPIHQGQKNDSGYQITMQFDTYRWEDHVVSGGQSRFSLLATTLAAGLLTFTILCKYVAGTPVPLASSVPAAGVRISALDVPCRERPVAVPEAAGESHNALIAPAQLPPVLESFTTEKDCAIALLTIAQRTHEQGKGWRGLPPARERARERPHRGQTETAKQVYGRSGSSPMADMSGPQEREVSPPGERRAAKPVDPPHPALLPRREARLAERRRQCIVGNLGRAGLWHVYHMLPVAL